MCRSVMRIINVIHLNGDHISTGPNSQVTHLPGKKMAFTLLPAVPAVSDWFLQRRLRKKPPEPPSYLLAGRCWTNRKELLLKLLQMELLLYTSNWTLQTMRM